jgi:putative Holliday junction resolvase
LNNDVAYIVKLLVDEKMVGLVIGLPLNMDGSQSLMVQRVKQFAHDILNKTNIPIYLQDERLSSFMAKDYIEENKDSVEAVLGKNYFKQNKEKIDSIAAKIILEEVLRS